MRRLVLVSPWGLRVPEHPTIDIFSIPDEQILEYLVADLTPYAGMPMPPPPEFLADRYREATSLARVLWKRPYDLKLRKWLHRIAAPTLVLWGDADRLIPVEQAADLGREHPQRAGAHDRRRRAPRLRRLGRGRARARRVRGRGSRRVAGVHDRGQTLSCTAAPGVPSSACTIGV